MTYQGDPGISTLQHKGHFTPKLTLKVPPARPPPTRSHMDSLKLAKVRRKADRPEKIPVTGARDSMSVYIPVVKPLVSSRLRSPRAALAAC